MVGFNPIGAAQIADTNTWLDLLEVNLDRMMVKSINLGSDLGLFDVTKLNTIQYDNNGDVWYITQGGVAIALTGVVATPSYTKYVALLSQTGTDDPVVTVLENTIGAIVWARTGVGFYEGTLVGAFPANKVFIVNSHQSVNDISTVTLRADDDQLVIITLVAGVLTDDILGAGEAGATGQIEIRVYP